MQTNTSQAPQADGKTSKSQRKTIILARLDKLQSKVPDGWRSWTYLQTKTFSDDLATLKRLASSNGSVSHVLRIGERVALAYGVPMELIDPCFGEAL